LDVSSMYHHYKPHDVYPVQIAKHKTAEAIWATHPTAEEFKARKAMTLDKTKFKLISHGCLVLYKINPSSTNKKKKNFIAYIHFTLSNLQLSEHRKHEYVFVTKFWHKLKNFVCNVQSKNISCGKMWTIGWRKSQDSGKMIGQYVDSDVRMIFNTQPGTACTSQAPAGS
jgi:hypothetical protein